jgi:hypothetical protein
MAPASRLRAALEPPRVPMARAPAPSSGQLRGRRVSPRLGLPLPARGSSGAAACPAAQAPAPAPGSEQLRGHRVSPRLGLPLPARGSSGTTTCPLGSSSRSRLGEAPGPPRIPRLCGLPASKQISFGGSTIMISIGAGAPVSSNSLRDKGCSACLQGMQQTRHVAGRL